MRLTVDVVVTVFVETAEAVEEAIAEVPVTCVSVVTLTPSGSMSCQQWDDNVPSRVRVQCSRIKSDTTLRPEDLVLSPTSSGPGRNVSLVPSEFILRVTSQS